MRAAKGSAARVPGLFQPGAVESLEVSFPLAVELDRQVGRDPGERDIGLHAPQFLQRGLGDLDLSGHAGGGGQHAVGADEIATVADALACEPDRLRVVASDVLGVGRDAIVDCRVGVARAQPEPALRRRVSVLPAPVIAKREAIIALRQREARIEPQRQFELGERIVQAPRIHVDGAER